MLVRLLVRRPTPGGLVWLLLLLSQTVHHKWRCDSHTHGAQLQLPRDTHTHPFNGPNGPLSGTKRVSWHLKGKTNQWHQLGYMQVCTSFQTDNHASTPPLSFLQAGCPSCRPTNSVKALKALMQIKCKLSESNSNV